MELKRVLNGRLFVLLLCMAAVSAVLFYNQQLREGEKELIRLDADHAGAYTVFDLNDRYQELLLGYAAENPSGSGEYDEAFVNQFFSRYYTAHIQKDTKDFWVYLTAKELLRNQIRYTAGYQEQIRHMRKQALNALKMGAFSDPQSFAYHNILKTRYDLKDHENIQTLLCNTRALDSIQQYRLTGYLMTAFMVYLGLCFLQEQKKGLWQIVHAAAGGRSRMAFRRLGILAIAALLSSVVLNGVILIESYCLYGGWESLTASIQSSPHFSYAPIQCIGAGYLGLLILAQAAAAFAAGAFIWGFMLLIDSPVLSGMALSGILLCEYAAYRFIPGTSSLGILKYANIYQMLTPMDFLADYANCGFLNRLISKSVLLWVIVVITGGIGVLLAVWCAKKKIPGAGYRSWLNTVSGVVSGYYHRGVARLPVYLMEVYKIMIAQRGFGVILLLGLMLVQIPVNGSVSYDETRSLLRDYYLEVGGNPPGALSGQKIQEYEQILGQKKAAFQALEDAFYSGEQIRMTEREDLSEEIRILSDALNRMKHQSEYLTGLKETRRTEAQIIMPFTYEELFGGRMDYSMNLVNLYAVLAVILLTAGSLSCERKTGLQEQLKSGINGRGPLIRRKLLVNEAVVLLVGGAVYGYYFRQVGRAFVLENLDCSILSIELLKHFPVNISIRAYLVFSFLLKLLLLSALMLMVTAVSLCVRYKYTVLAALALLCPHLLYLLGFEGFRYFSAVLPMDNWQMERLYGGGFRLYLIYAGIFLVAGLCGRFTVKRWIGRAHRC